VIQARVVKSTGQGLPAGQGPVHSSEDRPREAPYRPGAHKLHTASPVPFAVLPGAHLPKQPNSTHPMTLLEHQMHAISPREVHGRDVRCRGRGATGTGGPCRTLPTTCVDRQPYVSPIVSGCTLPACRRPIQTEAARGTFEGVTGDGAGKASRARVACGASAAAVRCAGTGGAPPTTGARRRAARVG
jgi:hypothetical protein